MFFFGGEGGWSRHFDAIFYAKTTVTSKKNLKGVKVLKYLKQPKQISYRVVKGGSKGRGFPNIP